MIISTLIIIVLSASAAAAVEAAIARRKQSSSSGRVILSRRTLEHGKPRIPTLGESPQAIARIAGAATPKKTSHILD